MYANVWFGPDHFISFQILHVIPVIVLCFRFCILWKWYFVPSVFMTDCYGFALLKVSDVIYLYDVRVHDCHPLCDVICLIHRMTSRVTHIVWVTSFIIYMTYGALSCIFCKWRHLCIHVSRASNVCLSDNIKDRVWILLCPCWAEVIKLQKSTLKHS